jgi:hypothetical protein
VFCVEVSNEMVAGAALVLSLYIVNGMKKDERSVVSVLKEISFDEQDNQKEWLGRSKN